MCVFVCVRVCACSLGCLCACVLVCWCMCVLVQICKPQWEVGKNAQFRVSSSWKKEKETRQF